MTTHQTPPESFVINQNTLTGQIGDIIPKTPGIYLLSGDLGTGKTTIIKKYCESVLNIPSTSMSSPTFGIINNYKTKKGNVYHIDLYRIKKTSELNSLPLEEILNEPNAYIFIEWPEILGTLEIPHHKITLEYLSPEQRRLTLTTHTSL